MAARMPTIPPAGSDWDCEAVPIVAGAVAEVELVMEDAEAEAEPPGVDVSDASPSSSSPLSRFGSEGVGAAVTLGPGEGCSGVTGGAVPTDRLIGVTYPLGV